jgi:hypothetical protein
MEEPSASSVSYDDKVLGEQVEVLRETEGGTDRFHSGSITKVMMELENNGVDISVRHFVEFQDGYTRWFDLAGEEVEGRLYWPADIGDGPDEVTSRFTAEDTTGEVETPVSKKRRIKWDSGAVRITDEEGGSPQQTEDTTGETSSGEAKPITEGVRITGSVSDAKEARIASLPDPAPRTVDDVIRLMDEIEPNKNYFARQTSPRGTVTKLRYFAFRNPDHPAVRHYMKNINIRSLKVPERWHPPNRESLYALMELIKFIIKSQLC